jgi:hypothetical protein
MMNEFAPKYFQVTRERSGSPTPAVNITAYLQMLARLGIRDGDMPAPQPTFQQRVRERFQTGEGPGRLTAVIGELSAEDGQFSTDGGSWTNDVPRVRGYQNALAPMQRASTLFSEHPLAPRRAGQRPPLPARALPPAGRRNQLLPLLRPGHLDRLRDRTRPPRQPGHQPDLTLLAIPALPKLTRSSSS